ncbi:MAG: hypothetical protein E6230_22800 [Paenibacillus dendritiformis]|nr:hypothetical protein [uncultured Paenibacillus sp.]MDU5145005.1 hypothetical protein [Paenibacillus dendritiformis]
MKVFRMMLAFMVLSLVTGCGGNELKPDMIPHCKGRASRRS